MRIKDQADTLEADVARISDNLTKRKARHTSYAYGYAYSQLRVVALAAIQTIRESDPAYDLQVMSYDEIVNREA